MGVPVIGGVEGVFLTGRAVEGHLPLKKHMREKSVRKLYHIEEAGHLWPSGSFQHLPLGGPCFKTQPPKEEGLFRGSSGKEKNGTLKRAEIPITDFHLSAANSFQLNPSPPSACAYVRFPGSFCFAKYFISVYLSRGSTEHLPTGS